jgi:hypothetical protein
MATFFLFSTEYQSFNRVNAVIARSSAIHDI